jgi:CRP-like cAMP-binding protein
MENNSSHESGDFSAEIPEFSLFHALKDDPVALQELNALLKYEVYQIRDYIIDERQMDSRAFFLLKGQVSINKIGDNGQIVVIGKTNDSFHPFFGESVLVGNFKRSANVVAQCQCECLSLSAQNFERFLAKRPAAAAVIYRALAKVLFDRLAKTTKDVFIAGLSR